MQLVHVVTRVELHAPRSAYSIGVPSFVVVLRPVRRVAPAPGQRIVPRPRGAPESPLLHAACVTRSRRIQCPTSAERPWLERPPFLVLAFGMGPHMALPPGPAVALDSDERLGVSGYRPLSLNRERRREALSRTPLDVPFDTIALMAMSDQHEARASFIEGG